MSDLNGFDAALILNQRVLANLAISADLMFGPTLRASEAWLDAAAQSQPLLHTWLGRGLDDPIGISANLLMPAPRLLYAVSNPAFPSSFAGNTDRERLLNRLAAYDSVASGPVYDVLPPNVLGFDNPYPITLKADANSRFTFVRSAFYDLNRRPEIQISSTSVRITLRGAAFRGDFFSSYHARHNPTHSFSLTLQYRVSFLVDDIPLNIKVPSFQLATYVMTAAPNPQRTPPLPAPGQVIYALPRAGGGYVLPTPPANLSDDDAVKQALVGAVPLRGQPGDLIYEPGGANPVYEIQPESDSNPSRFVLRQIGKPLVLAEARTGWAVLSFAGASNLTLTPLGGNAPVSGGELAVISRSLSRINPTLAQQFVKAAGLGTAALRLQELDLVGPTGLDIPLMPRSLVVATNPSFAQSGAVASDIVELSLTRDVYFPGNQAFGIGGKINGPPPQGGFGDFSGGADSAFAVSERGVNIVLGDIAKQFTKPIEKQAAQHIKLSQPIQVAALFAGDDRQGKLKAAGGFVITALVKGSIGVLFFDIGVTVTARVHLRMRLQPSVATNISPNSSFALGMPVDRFDCPIPNDLLSPIKGVLPNPAWLGLSLQDGKVELADPRRNPLAFTAYWDPFDGIVPIGAPTPLRLPPPVFDPVTLQEVKQPTCGDKPDNPLYYGQASFPPATPQNGGLKHHWDLAFVLPNKDDQDDVKVDVNIDLLALFALVLLGVLAIALAPIAFPGLVGLLGPLLPVLGFVVFSAPLLVPFVNLIASQIATAIARDKIAQQTLGPLDPNLASSVGLGLYLDDPNVRTPVLVQEDPPNTHGDSALVTRFHVVANLPQALSALPGRGIGGN